MRHKLKCIRRNIDFEVGEEIDNIEKYDYERKKRYEYEERRLRRIRAHGTLGILLCQIFDRHVNGFNGFFHAFSF